MSKKHKTPDQILQEQAALAESLGEEIVTNDDDYLANMSQANASKLAYKNPLVTMFTRDESMLSYLRDRLSYNFELILYDHYRIGLELWGVKCEVVPVENLTPSGHNLDVYDDYVTEAKKLGPGYYGVQANFHIEAKSEKKRDRI